jgi:hypothetical protein
MATISAAARDGRDLGDRYGWRPSSHGRGLAGFT